MFLATKCKSVLYLRFIGYVLHFDRLNIKLTDLIAFDEEEINNL